MAGILSRLSSRYNLAPRSYEETHSEAVAEQLQRYCFNVCAADGSAFTMVVMAPNREIASRCVKRYPGILSYDPVGDGEPTD